MSEKQKPRWWRVRVKDGGRVSWANTQYFKDEEEARKVNTLLKSLKSVEYEFTAEGE